MKLHTLFIAGCLVLTGCSTTKVVTPSQTIPPLPPQSFLSSTSAASKAFSSAIVPSQSTIISWDGVTNSTSEMTDTLQQSFDLINWVDVESVQVTTNAPVITILNVQSPSYFRVMRSLTTTP